MTDYVFMSRISACIENFIAQKRALGYPYVSNTRILRRFDLLVYEKFPNADTLTKEICTAWLHLKPDEHPNGLSRRVTPVRVKSRMLV